MSATERFFFGKADSEEIIRNLGTDPDHQTIRKVLDRLTNMGRLGVKGFDMSIRAYAIMRGDSEHIHFQRHVDGKLENFLKPFDFHEPCDSECEDHGLKAGFTYGLHVLAKTLDVELLDFEANSSIGISAIDHNTENYLLSKRVTSLPDPDMEFGYSEMPSNVSAVSGYLVFPKKEALQIIDQSSELSVR